MLGDAVVAQKFATNCKKGITLPVSYIRSYQGQARIRTQMSAARIRLSKLRVRPDAFTRIGKQLGVI